MKTKILIFITFAFIEFNLGIVESFAQKNNEASIYGTYFLALQNGKDAGTKYRTFSINRGYVAINKSINSFISSDVVYDTRSKADGEMDINLEFIFATFHLKDFGVITKPNIRVGVLHPVWFDFEESINKYRMQGTMVMDRAGIFGGSDYGLCFLGSFGGELDEDYKKQVNGKYPGKYGGFHIGLFNGGGQHAKDNNTNKVFQSRITLRPLPDTLPGLRVSTLGIFGQGNVEDVISEAPKWDAMNLMLTYETRYITFSGQTFKGKGNRTGTWVNSNLEAWENSGDSACLELKSNWAVDEKMKNLRFFGRFDHFDPDTDSVDNEYDLYIFGAGYDFGNGNVLVLDYEKLNNVNINLADSNQLKLTMQINY